MVSVGGGESASRFDAVYSVKGGQQADDIPAGLALTEAIPEVARACDDESVVVVSAVYRTRSVDAIAAEPACVEQAPCMQ